MDKIDLELLSVLLKRINKTKQIQEYKIKMGIPKKDLKREREILKKIKSHLLKNKAPKYQKKIKEIYQVLLA